MRIVSLITLLMLSYFASVSQGRLTDDMKDTEEQLYASTKQINQFFRRFNGEEDERGNRFYPGDRKFQDASLRHKYFPAIVNLDSDNLDSDLLNKFEKDVTDMKEPKFIDFHSGDWFAETSATFNYKGRQETVLLYMRIQAQGQGYEWVIDDVAFPPFKEMFSKDTSENKQFLHPMSHELDFMNLHKALKDNHYPEEFTPRSYRPDYLTLFLYELKRGNLKFETVNSVKFHFFSIDGWYFEVGNFNRPGTNSGWLIANLMQVSDSEKKLLKDYIYDKL